MHSIRFQSSPASPVQTQRCIGYKPFQLCELTRHSLQGERAPTFIHLLDSRLSAWLPRGRSASDATQVQHASDDDARTEVYNPYVSRQGVPVTAIGWMQFGLESLYALQRVNAASQTYSYATLLGGI